MTWERALVTGASAGIGEALCRRLAAGGSDLVLVARRRERLASLADELATATGVDVEVLAADLTDAGELERVADRVADEGAPVDLVVNNAGIASNGTFWELDVAREADLVRVHALAVQRLAHAALSAMVPRGRGGLLTVASMASFQPMPGAATYAAVKAFARSLSEALHEEVRGTGVHVTCVCPGFVRTEMTADEALTRRLPELAWIDLDKVVAEALASLARGEALCIPTLRYKLLAETTRLTPRGIVRRAQGLVHALVRDEGW